VTERLLLAASWHRSAVAVQFRALARALHDAGVEVHWLDDRHHADAQIDPWIAQLHRWPKNRAGIAPYRFAHQLVRSLRPSIVIANFGAVTPLGIAAWRTGVARRVCWYHTVSDQIALDVTGTGRIKHAVAFAGRRLAYRTYTDVVAVSGAAAADYAAVFGRSGPVVTARHNAVADGAHRHGPVPADAPIVAAGRFDKSKGFDVLVRAAGQLDPPPRVQIMGEGAEHDELVRLAGELGVDLDLPGVVAQGSVRGHMADAAAVVVPSRAEAFGLVAIEGLAAGTPVVASAVGGPAEIVRSGETGALVPPDDPDALAAALRTVLDPERNQVMGEAARRDYLERFEVQAWATDLAQRLRSGADLGS
jgi:glycosyltransferase involved in cell wall biosynthesis